ncbi:MAG: sugar ABC transporter ATP-binding protein [Candidatus Bipolaricaulota bacterium]
MTEKIAVESVTKTFPGVTALDDVSLSMENGAIYSLVGENGAGKSTFIKILAGIYRADEGKIFVDGEEVHYKNSMEALTKYGIACVHQESTLIPNMTIAENFFLETEYEFSHYGALSKEEMSTMAAEILDEFEMDIEVNMLAKKLSPGESRIVELAKALHFEPDFLILDEITATLAEDELDEVFKRIKAHKEKGKTVIFISHRIGEVMKVSDEAIVLKDGEFVGTLDRENLARDELVNMMVGERSASTPFPEKADDTGEPVFAVENLKGGGIEVDLEVREGEILALSGLKGHGMSEVLRMIYGVQPRESGDFYLNGDQISLKNPKQSKEEGVIYISDDKDKEELWTNLSVKENIVIPSFKEYSNKLGFLKDSDLNNVAEESIKRFDIDTPSKEALVKKLSGGNRQKVVFGKWLTRDPKVIIANRPAIGLDVSAKEEVYHILRGLAQKGVAVLTFLSELPEVVNLPDRVLVMRTGRIVEELEGKNLTEENVVQAYYKDEGKDRRRLGQGEFT